MLNLVQYTVKELHFYRITLNHRHASSIILFQFILTLVHIYMVTDVLYTTQKFFITFMVKK